jgi:hypothetical protein
MVYLDRVNLGICLQASKMPMENVWLFLGAKVEEQLEEF